MDMIRRKVIEHSTSIEPGSAFLMYVRFEFGQCVSFEKAF